MIPFFKKLSKSLKHFGGKNYKRQELDNSMVGEGDSLNSFPNTNLEKKFDFKLFFIHWGSMEKVRSSDLLVL